MRRRFLAAILGFVLGFLAVPVAAEAQQPPKVARVGYLTLFAGPTPRDGAFRQGLRDLGYVEGKSLVIEYRWAAGKADRLPELAAELARLKVDVFVMAAVGDPVASGLVATLARPGGNITGFTVFSSELTGKRLQLLREVVPRASRIGVLATGRTSRYTNTVYLPEAEAAAKALGIHLRPAVVEGPSEFAGAFAAMTKEGVGALLVQISPILSDHRQRAVDLAAKHRLPAMYEAKGFADAGGLVSYGPDVADQFRRAAQYVDKILKGAKPGDLLVQQPTRLELVINLKTAKALRLTIPQSILIRADHVIQ